MSHAAPPPISSSSATEASADERPPTRGGGFWLALASLAFALLIAEGALRIFHPLPDPLARYKVMPLVAPNTPYVPSAWLPDTRYRVRAEPGLSGIDTAVRLYTTNNLGFRGPRLEMPKPAGEIRVFMVGGSTTECYFLDDREAVTARLEAHLRQLLPGRDVRVYGAGHSGDRTFDHVAMVSQRIAHLQPDVIIVFAGVNDLNAGITGRDYLMRDAGEPMPRIMPFRLASTEFQLGRLVQQPFGMRDRGVVVSTVARRARQRAARPLTPFPHRPDPAAYRENLETLAGITRAHGARFVMMTQATLWNGPDPRASRWFWLWSTRRHSPAALDSAMRAYNRAMLDAGARQHVPVFDLFDTIPRTLDYFYDDVHFNVRGADTAARLLAAFMVDRGVFAADSSLVAKP